MKPRETAVAAASRMQMLDALRKHYSTFVPFLEDVMAELGFDTTDMQRDIANYIAYGPQNLMVQAQRGEAKTTIAAAFAVFHLIHLPQGRVLVVSAGGTQAIEISTLIVRIVMTMDVLECMRPDKAAGDRASVEAFDIHHSLKGLDKSPSVACVGIDANLPGKRATLLIPDDVESNKNSATPTQREKLLHTTREFPSICSGLPGIPGRTVWLGTPQTMESTYNTLPQRGVVVRIWPGRYPTPAQLARYGGNLAPYILQRLAADPSLGTGGGLLGDQGKASDPDLKSEEQLQQTELQQGTAYFQLQHMLNTTLMDGMRFPLKPDKLVVIRSNDRFPLMIQRGYDSNNLRQYSTGSGGFSFSMMSPHDVSRETAKLTQVVAYIDPAGGGANGDETAYAVGGLLNGNIFLLSAGAVRGGYSEASMDELARKITRFNLDLCKIEKNMGHGAFAAVFTPILRKYSQCGIEDDFVTGQKEKRIIDTLEPIMGRGSLIVCEDVVEEDTECSNIYGPANRQVYSLFYQLAKISLVRNALAHDDRLDALEGLCRHFTRSLAKDQAHVVEQQRRAEHEAKLKDPLGYTRYDHTPKSVSIVDRYRRR